MAPGKEAEQMIQPFSSANTNATHDQGRITWAQQVARNYHAHPDWDTSTHMAALRQAVPEIDNIAVLNDTTVRAMVAAALEEAAANPLETTR
jgi:hypothetical protein